MRYPAYFYDLPHPNKLAQVLAVQLKDVVTLLFAEDDMLRQRYNALIQASDINKEKTSKILLELVLFVDSKYDFGAVPDN